MASDIRRRVVYDYLYHMDMRRDEAGAYLFNYRSYEKRYLEKYAKLHIARIRSYENLKMAIIEIRTTQDTVDIYETYW